MKKNIPDLLYTAMRCELCNRSFGSQRALSQHLQDSPAHTLSYECIPCNRSFNSQDALSQHLQDSPAHTLSYECIPCNRSFNSQNALNQHTRDSPSPAHFRLPNTPLNAFFQSFPGFTFDPDLPPSQSYVSLQRFHRWKRGDEASAHAWDRFQDALAQEFRLWFGAEDDIGAWHALCRAVRVEPLPRSCRECEKAVRGKYVNIVDLIDWARNRGKNSDESEGEVRLFRNLQDLRDYTRKTRRIFRLAEARTSNVVLRHLLRFIF